MAKDDEPLKKYKRPVLPFERKADPGYRGGGMAAAGIEFAAVVAVFLFTGLWLDKRFDTDPWFTIVLSMLGVGAAMTLLIRAVMRVSRARSDTETDENEDKEEGDGPA